MTKFSLKGQRAFQRVSREGRRFIKDFMQLRICENHLTVNRLGIIIPEKAIRLAVDRNRVRRLISESFRIIAKDLDHGYDIVFIVREKPLVNKMQFVLSIMTDLFKKAGIIKIASNP